jgi:hypothetical protein
VLPFSIIIYSFAAETARPEGSSLASADPHLLDLCRDEGISVIALPDSTGRTWKR